MDLWQYKKNNPKVMSDINVTPLVDVMLVLLAIFMIAAPTLFSGVSIDLPTGKKNSSIRLSSDKVILSITTEGKIFINENSVKREELKTKLLSKLETTKDKTVYIQADYSVGYGPVANVISEIKNYGVSSLSLVTENE